MNIYSDYRKLNGYKGASCGQHSALSTQHSALSTQHSALSTQHSALSTLNRYFVFLTNARGLVTSCLFLTFAIAHAAPIYYNPWDRVPVASAELACQKAIDFFQNNPPNTYVDWKFDSAKFDYDFDSSVPGANGNYFAGSCRMLHTNPQVGTGDFYLPFSVECLTGHIIVKKDSNTAICTSQGLSITLTPAPNQKDPRPKGTEGKDPKSSTYELIARVMEGSTPKAGVAVTFAVEVEPNTGGHDHHDASRPKGLVNGALTASGVTEANGEIKVTFQASQIAGTHVVAAVCESCTNKSVTKNVDVKVPDLVPFLALPFRTQQWNPAGIGQTVEHRDNHYLTVAATYRLLEIATKYKKIWPTAPTLTLNDGSLKWGGKFDIDGTWEVNPRRHAEHRLGDNIDIRANAAPGNVPSDIRPEVFRWLRKLSTKKDNIPPEYVIESVNPLHEGIGLPNEHFHLRLGN